VLVGPKEQLLLLREQHATKVVPLCADVSVCVYVYVYVCVTQTKQALPGIDKDYVFQVTTESMFSTYAWGSGYSLV
jgi:hypothetical protein